MQKRKIFITAIFLLFFQCVFSQTTTGRIDGVIIDEKGFSFGGVLVKLSGSSLLGVRTSVSDESGRFRYISVPAGDYQIILEQGGLKKVILKNIRVSLGRNTSLGEIRIDSSTMQTYVIEVEGERSLIDYLDSSSSGNISNDSISSLPVGRDYKSLITTFPEINENYYGDQTNFSGATGTENVFYLNGNNVTDPLGKGGTLNLPYNFIKEIEIKNGGYEAEFGRTMGGLVNVITHSGTNNLAGKAFGFFTNSAFISTKRYGLNNAEMEDHSDFDIGFSMGGPFKKDKTWFFIAYNRKFENSNFRITDSGIVPEKVEKDMFAVKLDWKPGKLTNISFSLTGDPEKRLITKFSHPVAGSVISVSDIDTIAGRSSSSGLSFSIIANTFISKTFLLDIYSSVYTKSYSESGRTNSLINEPILMDQNTGEWSGGWGLKKEQTGERYSTGIKATLFFKEHTIKAGLEYEENRMEEYQKWPDPGQIFKTGDIYAVVTMDREFTAVNRVPTIFIQDTWEITKWMTFNLGLRWDGQYLYGEDKKPAQQITDQWQPRFGFIIKTGKQKKDKIFGSAGRYYHQYQVSIGEYYDRNLINYLDIYIDDPRTPGSVPFLKKVLDYSNIYFGGVKDLKGHHYDEMILGYKKIFKRNLSLSIIAKYRDLKEAYGFGLKDGNSIIGNLGKGNLSFLPAPKREYTSIQFILKKNVGDRLNYFISYTWSKNYGNYGGLYSQEHGYQTELQYLGFQTENQIENSIGLLSNDRTHVIKLSGFYKFSNSLTASTYISLISGTPMNVFWDNDSVHFARWGFYVPRGTAGRTPMLFDLNLRLTWSPDLYKNPGYGLKFYLDMLHIRNWESAQPLLYDQLKYLGEEVDNEGIPLQTSPGYGQVLRYQDPMKVRLGLEFSFGKE